MTKKEKLEQRIRSNPTPTDISLKELCRFLAQNGFVCRGTTGSHTVWKNAATERSITVAAKNRYVKTYLVKEAIKAVDNE